ncbi:amidohydrolase [Actinomadura macrotermitis]|uniref:N-substituted formamide deformylase n=1 Tax=Actinomadura macrotermitis TaxID=2585200 RepID=A0A7K0C7N8_9ACTN|nr:amidohydrolase [Actinomadura macrotermitis]MQY08794.1 N-substituted formamide deformylase [Actinomadura macrotermitis]
MCTLCSDHGRRAFLGGSLAAVAAAALPALPAAAAAPRPHGAPDTVYHGGTVVPLAPGRPDAQAIAVTGGRITAIGSDRRIRALAARTTEQVDLRGTTLLPGFIDAHSHLPAPGLIGLYWADLSSPPVGTVTGIADLIAALKTKAAAGAPGAWILGWGYDQTLLAEGRHPTAADLDQVSATAPIWAAHTNGHMGVANTAALRLAGITEHTPDPPGGVIARDPATGRPTGLLQEAATTLVTRHQPALTPAQLTAAARATDALYAAAGVTTTVVAGGGADTYAALNAWRAAGVLRLRALLMLNGDPLAPGGLPLPEGTGDDRVRVSGYGEAVYDGSIQGYTGYLTQPYHRLADGLPAGYRGYTNYPADLLKRRVDALYAAGYAIRLHANGDAAIDDLLDAYEAAIAKHGRRDHRMRVEHAQTARPDQLRRMRRLGVTASFFVSHTYYWGDQHRDVFLGPERAARISPLRSAQRLNLRHSLHLDSPVVPMSPLQALWSAVNRTTRSGRVLGPAERVTPARALRALTIDAAWQHFHDHDRGSLEPGKLADLTVLSADPRTVPPQRIKDVQVLRTVVGGTTVHHRD